MNVINVDLPCGEAVIVPSNITDEWFTHGKTGYVDPKFLAPYAAQPRIYMDEEKLSELEASIKANGVRDAIVVTPTSMAPWIKGVTLPFIIVSGHRRRQCAQRANVCAVPIVVRTYANKAAFDADADTLNNHRVDISDLEQGWVYRRKIDDKENGRTYVTDIMAETGYSRKTVQDRIDVTYLCPRIQERISPKLKRRERMALGLAAALGGLKVDKKGFDLGARLAELGDKKPIEAGATDEQKRFRLQHAYLSYCEKRGWKGTISAKFVLTGQAPAVKVYSNATGRQAPKDVAETKMPSGLRMQLIGWFEYLNTMGLLDMKMAVIEKALTNAMGQDLEEMAQMLEFAATTLREVAAKKPVYSEAALATGQPRLEERILAS